MILLKQIRTQKYHIIGVDLGNPGSYVASGVVFGREGDQLHLIDSYVEQGMEGILAQISKHSRVLLLLQGDQILTRFSDREDHSLFEEIEREEFYMQSTQSTEGVFVQSACRKSAIDPLISLLSDKKLFLLDISLEPAVLPELEKHMEGAVLYSQHMRFVFKDHHLKLIEEHLDVEENESHGEYLVAGMAFLSATISHLAALLRFFNRGPGEMGSLAENASESKFYRLFQRAGVGILAVFFLLLLLNFLWFSQIQTELDSMKSSGEELTKKIEQIEQLKAQIYEYRNLTLNSDKLPGETYSCYLEEIARARPSGVWYNKLIICPLSKKQELNKALELDHSIFTLSGETKDPVSLNRLINTLEEKPWVLDIELRNYESLADAPGAGFELAIRKAE